MEKHEFKSGRTEVPTFLSCGNFRLCGRLSQEALPEALNVNNTIAIRLKTLHSHRTLQLLDHIQSIGIL